MTKKMTAPVIHSITVSSPRGLAPAAARRPPRLARDRGGPRSGGRTMALHRLHGSPAAARAADPRLGSVVVASHSREWQVGPGGGCDYIKTSSRVRVMQQTKEKATSS